MSAPAPEVRGVRCEVGGGRWELELELVLEVGVEVGVEVEIEIEVEPARHSGQR